MPPRLHAPLEVRAPEILFNHLSPLLKVEVGARIDVWSMGCLVRPQEINLRCKTDAKKKIYELATSLPLIGWYPSDEAMALRKLTNILGPLPEEWIASLGTQIHPWKVLAFQRNPQERRMSPAPTTPPSNKWSDLSPGPTTHPDLSHYFSRFSYLTHYDARMCQTF